ncbi:hypothetical protein A2U01_0044268, partial [Trifolium medium]|nr:hypothetical protein [Trifolium medium]
SENKKEEFIKEKSQPPVSNISSEDIITDAVPLQFFKSSEESSKKKGKRTVRRKKTFNQVSFPKTSTETTKIDTSQAIEQNQNQNPKKPEIKDGTHPEPKGSLVKPSTETSSETLKQTNPENTQATNTPPEINQSNTAIKTSTKNPAKTSEQNVTLNVGTSSKRKKGIATLLEKISQETGEADEETDSGEG